MLDTDGFADAIRIGVARSGLGEGRPVAEVRFASLAGAILEYLKDHLEVTVPAGALPAGPGQDPSPPIPCKIS